MACRLLGTTDAALVLGCSAERVRQLEREGKLPAEKTLGGRRVFAADDVERLAVEREGQRLLKQKTARAGEEERENLIFG